MSIKGHVHSVYVRGSDCDARSLHGLHEAAGNFFKRAIGEHSDYPSGPVCAPAGRGGRIGVTTGSLSHGGIPRNAALERTICQFLIAARRERAGAAQEIENPHPIEGRLAVCGDDPIPVRCEGFALPGARVGA